jgi:uncharacterized protein with ParB-like and HNH nuclease domain/predicted transport protein
MKATEAKLLEFIKKSPQFIIPIYQRTYSWTKQECRQLWDDILRTGADDAVTAHFVGSIVYIEQGLYQVSTQSPLLVIDGQQRLTTVSLIIEALARALGDAVPMDGFSSRKLRNYYLLNPEEDGERRYKLILSQTDRASLKALLDGQAKPKDHSIRIEENFSLFQQWATEQKDRLSDLCRGLAKLIVVDIALSRDQDNAQLIFESLNSTGRELSQADLIRNFILMGLEPRLQSKLYERHWRPMEVEFGQEGYVTQFDGFMRHYLTVKTGDIPNVRQVYDAFKQHARSPKAGNVEALVQDIHTYARYFCNMALGAESDAELNAAFQDLRELRVDVAYPFLLELYRDYALNKLSKQDLLQAVRLIESYVFRRAICEIPTNSLNKTFATIGRSIEKERYIESISAHFLLLPSYRRFPSDEEFGREMQTKDLYTFSRRSYWLRRLENYNRKERVHVDEYTIEHIMPQNEKLSDEWRQSLGDDWKRIHNTYLHTLGNLTLTGYNSEYSDRPFAAKRDLDGGFAQSPLRLNQELGMLTTWNEQAIRDRADRLAAMAVQVWAAPQLADGMLDRYRPKTHVSGYTINDHAHLVSGAMRELFEAFRAEVLALDPCVTEEFLKLYVAYKAETNFVDVVPQAKRLRLSLNMRFHEIDDPRGICKDISATGRWGNGDVEVGLSSFEQLPYVMGLVRQSFERQMGGGEGA